MSKIFMSTFAALATALNFGCAIAESTKQFSPDTSEQHVFEVTGMDAISEKWNGSGLYLRENNEGQSISVSSRAGEEKAFITIAVKIRTFTEYTSGTECNLQVMQVPGYVEHIQRCFIGVGEQCQMTDEKNTLASIKRTK